MKNCVVANSEIGSDGRLISDFNLLFFFGVYNNNISFSNKSFQNINIFINNSTHISLSV